MLSANVSANGIELEDPFTSPQIGTRSDLDGNGRSSAKPLGGDLEEDVFPEQDSFARESNRSAARNVPNLNQIQEDHKKLHNA